MKKILFLAAALMMFSCGPIDNPIEPEPDTPVEKPEEKPEEKPVEPETPEEPEQPEEPAAVEAIMDVVFNEDGTATDASKTGATVRTIEGSTLVTYYSGYSKSYVARFNNKIGENTSEGYYRAQYASKTAFKNALKDGHSLEVMFMVDDELPGNKEIKMFSSHQSGGTGFLITKAEKNQEITFLPHVGGNYRWAQSGITPQRGRYYHVVGVWDKEAGKARIYVDGELKNEVDAAGDFKMVGDSYQWFGVGADSGDKGDNAWRGDVVIARVYDEALTDEQVAQLKTRADYGFPISEVVLDDVLYLSGFDFAAGSNYTILGRGFKNGDRIVWEAAGYSASVSGTVTEEGIKITLPSDLASGKYKLLLDRSGSIFPLGMVEIRISGTAAEFRIPKVIAHRCYHTAGAPENSLEAFTAAQKLGGVYGAEVDVYITNDDVIMIHHDGKLDGVTIETSSFAQVENLKLSNGEKLPTLASILEQAKKDPSMKVIIEIKDHKDVAREQKCVDKAMQMVEEAGLKNQVEYIAFDYELCKRIVKNDSEAVVGYLNGDKAPATVFADGILSVDYQLGKFTSNPTWIDEAHKLGMIVNTWTINTDADMLKSISLGVDYISTDYPDRLQDIFKLLE